MLIRNRRDARSHQLVEALGGRPGALILDEPTATLSHEESEVLFATVDKLRRDARYPAGDRR